MNKKQVLDSLQQLIPYKEYNKSDEEIVHIKEVIGPDRTFNDRSICSLISAIHELTDDPTIKELALEAICISGRMHKTKRQTKTKEKNKKKNIKKQKKQANENNTPKPGI